MNEDMLPPQPDPVLPGTGDADAPARHAPPLLRPGEPVKVGLALAGGGFRASLFHLGVFRRLAELDVLRRVEVLSTVSGGSIIGALYVLLLRERWLRPGTARLTRADYLEIVDAMEAALRDGVRANLRNRLFLNPAAMLRTAVTPFSLGNRMARLYERHLYRGVVDRLRARRGLAPTGHEPGRPGAFPLSQIRPVPGAFALGGEAEGRVGELPGGIESYNRAQALDPAGCAVTRLVVNATSMNAGARFWFSGSEVGDWYLGHVRPSEATDLLRLKRLREALARAGSVEAALARPCVEASADEAALAVWVARVEDAAREAERTGRLDLGHVEGDEARWDRVVALPGATSLVTVALGRLRDAKLPAWYARVGRAGPEPVGGPYATDTETRRAFRAALHDLDDALGAAVTDANEDDVMDLVLGVYALRGAAVVAPGVEADLERLTIGEAVGASACFPPVFSPFMVGGIYDDAHVGRLGLTDGGVFDNAGLTALLDERCSCVIASDTGGVFDVAPRAGSTHVGMLARLSTILQADLGRAQRSFVRERRRVNRDLERIETPEPSAGPAAPAAGARADAAEASPAVEVVRDQVRAVREARHLNGLAYFQMADGPPDPTQMAGAEDGVPLGEAVPPALAPPVAPYLLARVRTDLDGFGEAEVDALANHGYLLADANVRSYLARFAGRWEPEVPWSAPPSLPWPAPRDEAERQSVADVVRVGGQRFFRSILLLRPASLIPVLVLTALVLGTVGFLPEIAGAATEAFRAVDAALRSLGAWPDWRAGTRLAWTLAAAGGLAAGLGLAWWRYRMAPWMSARGPRVRRGGGTLRKWAPRVAPWLLLVPFPGLRAWVAVWLAVVAVGLPLYAVVHHVFFYLPFRSATGSLPRR